VSPLTSRIRLSCWAATKQPAGQPEAACEYLGRILDGVGELIEQGAMGVEYIRDRRLVSSSLLSKWF
jgi:hypothetical protein